MNNRLKSTAMIFLCLFSISSSIFAEKNPRSIASKTHLAPLAHTDGNNLIRKLAPLDKATQQANFLKGKQSCEKQCVTPFGQLLGEADGVKGLSNCQSTCIKPAFSFLDLNNGEIVVTDKNPDEGQFHYIGLVYQCVEYARKWWMKNHNMTFGSIDSAFEILYLTEGKNIRTNQIFALARSINGSAKKAPKKGDLLIYAADRNRANWRHGHVAVVVDVDLKTNAVYVAEENYNNQPWQDPKKYARRLDLVTTDLGYRVIDQDPYQTDPSALGIISGWIYPLQQNQ